MASVYVITRVSPRTGKRSHLVRYRLGGRETKAIHAGTFPVKRLAEERAKVIQTMLARGEIPRLDIIDAGSSAPTVAQTAEDYLAARKIDASDKTLKVYRQATKHFGPMGDLLVAQVTVKDVQDWVTRMTGTLAPSTVRKYLDFFRLVLDEAEREPNPARSRKVRLPLEESEEINPPPFEHWVGMLDAISPKYKLHILLMESAGLRIGELFALTWGDVDSRGSRLRIARQRTKGRAGQKRGRFVYPEPEVMAWIDDLVPREDRVPDALIFDGNESSFRRALTNACKFAGVPHYYPHHLRHRFISLRMQAGWPPRSVSTAVGHSKTSMTLDTYSHVLTDEPQQVLIDAANEHARWSRGASVVPSPDGHHEESVEYAG